LAQHQIVEVSFAEEILDAGFIGGHFHRVVQVLGHFAELHVAALEPGDQKLPDELLARQVTHHGRVA